MTLKFSYRNLLADSSVKFILAVYIAIIAVGFVLPVVMSDAVSYAIGDQGNLFNYIVSVPGLLLVARLVYIEVKKIVPGLIVLGEFSGLSHDTMLHVYSNVTCLSFKNRICLIIIAIVFQVYNLISILCFESTIMWMKNIPMSKFMFFSWGVYVIFNFTLALLVIDIFYIAIKLFIELRKVLCSTDVVLDLDFLMLSKSQCNPIFLIGNMAVLAGLSAMFVSFNISATTIVNLAYSHEKVIVVAILSFMVPPAVFFCMTWPVYNFLKRYWDSVESMLCSVALDLNLSCESDFFNIDRLAEVQPVLQLINSVGNAPRFPVRAQFVRAMYGAFVFPAAVSYFINTIS